jgi:hypothetical protein
MSHYIDDVPGPMESQQTDPIAAQAGSAFHDELFSSSCGPGRPISDSGWQRGPINGGSLQELPYGGPGGGMLQEIPVGSCPEKMPYITNVYGSDKSHGNGWIAPAREAGCREMMVKDFGPITQLPGARFAIQLGLNIGRALR